MKTVAKPVLTAIAVLILVVLGIMYFTMNQTPKVEDQSACSREPIYVASGETPPAAILRAADQIRDEGRIPTPLDIDPTDAALALIHQFDGGNVPTGASVMVCASQIEIMSVNGKPVD